MSNWQLFGSLHFEAKIKPTKAIKCAPLPDTKEQDFNSLIDGLNVHLKLPKNAIRHFCKLASDDRLVFLLGNLPSGFSMQHIYAFLSAVWILNKGQKVELEAFDASKHESLARESCLL